MPLSDHGGMELRDYLSVLRRRKLTIAFCALVVVGVAMALSLVQTPLYEAKARLLIGRERAVFGADQGGASDPAFVETQMQVIKSQGVRDLVRKTLGSAPNVSTTAVGTTSIVEIGAVSPRARDAAAISNAYTEAYLTFRRQQVTDELAAASREIQGRVDGLQKQIDELSNRLSSLPSCPAQAQSGPCSERESLQQDRDALVTQQVPFKQKLDQLQVNASVGDTGARVVTPAAVPGSPIRPTPVRNGVLALGLGLLLGTALAFLFDYLDNSIKGKEDLERSSRNLAVLGIIPAIPAWKERGQSRLVAMSEPSSPSAEAYRTLRTSIRFLAVDRPLRTIQITSPSPGEGKTTTTANLAVVLARAGERVVIASCDLRRPRVHQFFGLSNDVGFTSVLLGEAPLSAALQPVGDDERLWVLASGPLPPNPSELLSSARAGEVLAGLQGFADIVLIDCPPVLPVTDAALLSPRVDGTLLVATVGSSTGKQVARAVELLNQVGARLVGTVLNNAPPESAYSYGDYAYIADDQPRRALSVKGAARRLNGSAQDRSGEPTATDPEDDPVHLQVWPTRERG